MDLRTAIRDYSDYATDLGTSDHQSFADRLKRFMALFEADLPLATAATDELPKVNFEEWLTSCEATCGGLAGSGKLEWPVDRKERVALQLELLKRISSRKLNFPVFCNHFMPPGTPDIEVRAFLNDVVYPFRRDFLRILESRFEPPRREPHVQRTGAAELIDLGRLSELRSLPYRQFDFTRLIRLCEEMNSCYRIEAFHAVALLARAIIDHVPPLLGKQTFGEVVNNRSESRSFRETVDHLDKGVRKIADSHLHTPIRASEVVPNAAQVNFANYFDVLLGEIVRLHK